MLLPRRWMPILGILVGAWWVMGTPRDAEVPPVEPEEVVRAFFDALSRSDLEAAMALVGEDFVLRQASGTYTADREALTKILEWDVAAQGRGEIENLETEGEVVQVRLREWNRFIELLDLDPFRVELTFVVRDGLIRQEVIREMTGRGPSFTDQFHQALEPVIEWAARNRPDDVASVFDDGRVSRYDAPTARRLIELLEAYRGEHRP